MERQLSGASIFSDVSESIGVINRNLFKKAEHFLFFKRYSSDFIFDKVKVYLLYIHH